MQIDKLANCANWQTANYAYWQTILTGKLTLCKKKIGKTSELKICQNIGVGLRVSGVVGKKILLVFASKKKFDWLFEQKFLFFTGFTGFYFLYFISV